jgi:hypothetical protein
MGRADLAETSKGFALAAIKCSVCCERSLFRINFYLSKKLIQRRLMETELLKLYRIPGLCYQKTMKDGVGLLLWDRRIIGRMIYGTYACNCRPNVEDVAIA